MIRAELKERIRRNLQEAGIEPEEVRVQPDPYSGWNVAVIAAGFSKMSGEERRGIVQRGLEDVRFEWLDLLTPGEREWAGELPIDSDLEDLPLWPEALARAGREAAEGSDVVFPSDLDEDIPPPIIVTFYSLRGGVGRSTALAYTGRILASHGRKVVCVDLDLEAPGLAALFGKEKEIGPEQGLVHLLAAFDRGETPEVTPHLLRITESEDLYCLPAGRPDAEYARLLNFVDPRNWYREERNPLRLLFEQLRTNLPFVPDVLLLDARTGITSLSGPLLFDLADLSVIVFFPHPQAETGTAALVRALLAAHTSRRSNGKALTPEPRFLVSPIPNSKAPQVVRDYENRSVEWIARWLHGLEDRGRGTPLEESDITHFVPYREAIATSDRILTERAVWRDFEPVANWVERFLPTVGEKSLPESLAARKPAILAELSFSGGTAEHQGAEFLETFVETESIQRALDLKLPLVRGRKGTGKTAIFRRLSEGSEVPVVVVSAPGPLRTGRPWLLGADGLREIERVLAEKQADWRQFWTLATCLAAWFGRPETERGATQPADPRFAALVSSRILGSDLDTVQLIEELLAAPRSGLLATDWLGRIDHAAERPTILLFDGLDTGFGSSDDDRKRRTIALEGLFSLLIDRGDGLSNLHFKILLREDIWRHLKFENKSHLFGRSVELKWNDQASFLKVALKQAQQSTGFRTLLDLRKRHLGQDVEQWAEEDVLAAWNLLVGERMKGGQTTFTRNWVWTRLADSNGDHSPRYLLQLMQLAKEWEVQEHGKSPYERSILRPRSFEEVLPEVSQRALSALREEEFQELDPFMQRLIEIGRTPFPSSELDTSSGEFAALAREVGLLGIHEGSEESVERYKVPDLFRWGLKMGRQGPV